MASDNAFPHFINGDVEIVLTPIRRLRLHSDVLRGASYLFAELLTTENAAVLSKKALSEGRNVRYLIELVNASTTLGNSPGKLTVIKLDPNGHAMPWPGQPRASMFLSSAAADPSNHLLADWTSVLGALHGATELRIDSDTLTGIIASASSILDIVDYLRLHHPILAPLELALLGSEQALWQSVCAAPIPWANLAVRLRSFHIFREACCHVVGGWAAWSEEQKGELRREVRELCARKAGKFEGFKESLEEKLLEYRHEKLRYDPKVDKGRGKKTHEPDVLIWQAQYLLMNWFARMFREGRGRSAVDGGYGLYKMLWEGSCCEPIEQARLSPLTPAGRNVVAGHVREMQEDLKNMVKPVMISNLRLDQSVMPANRLTPFTFKSRDCPWDAKNTTDKDSSHRSHHSRRQEAVQHIPDEENDLEDFIS